MMEAVANATGASPDPRLSAVRARDASADGSFVYSVSTTGVYCRPSCASRAARPGHMAFYDCAADAERAGFRPCLRCHPELPPRAEREATMVAALCRLIETSEQPPTLEVLARSAGLSPFHTHRLFKKVTGVTPRAYARAHRDAKVRVGLGNARTVTEAIYDAGYGSASRFYEGSAGALGMVPGTYRSGGQGEVIRFAVGRCSLGAVLVAATDRGVCAVSLGDDPEALIRALAHRFHRATLVGGDEAFGTVVARVIALVEHPAQGSTLPLDIRGTAFQQRVWAALRETAPGQTTTYAALAQRLGAPRAARAVAGACAANAIAVAIPCHRVVRTDGDLSGYRWGVERKRALLTREAGVTDGVAPRTPRRRPPQG